MNRTKKLLFPILLILNNGTFGMNHPSDVSGNNPHPAHQAYASANAKNYYENVARQKPSFLEQAGHDILVSAGTQVVTTLCLSGIAAGVSAIVRLASGPSDAERESALNLKNSEQIIQKNNLALKEIQLNVEKKSIDELLAAVKNLTALPDELLSKQEKEEFRDNFRATLKKYMQKKQSQLLDEEEQENLSSQKAAQAA